MHYVTPDYFQTLRMHLLEGRWLNPSDCGDCSGRNGAPGAVINEELAREVWPGRDAAGRRFRLGTPVPDSPWITVVGVAGDTKEQGLEGDPLPEIYMATPVANDILIRAAGNPLELAPAIRARIRSADRSQAIYDVYPLEERISESVRSNRTLTWLLGIFAGLAAVLAAVGIYSMVAHSVSQRTRELGIRMALGAEPGDVRRLVLRQGMLPVLGGVAMGIAGAFGATRVLRTFLFGVKADDPATFVAVTLLLIGIGLLACYVPAYRSTKIDPMEALRDQ